MIGFGELRKRSLAWQIDVGEVERAYATGWLLKAIFEQAELAARLVLRGSAALRYAYAPDYPVTEPPEFLDLKADDTDALKESILSAVHAASAGPSGIPFLLVALAPGNIKVEYTGPLGRRSAAQLRIALALVAGRPRLAPAQMLLVHPFDEPCPASVAAVAREELVAERLATLQAAPRARDVYDLWFALTHWANDLDLSAAHTLARKIALQKGLRSLQTGRGLDPVHRAALERTWDAALGQVPGRPSLDQVERDVAAILSA